MYFEKAENLSRMRIAFTTWRLCDQPNHDGGGTFLARIFFPSLTDIVQAIRMNILSKKANF